MIIRQNDKNNDWIFGQSKTNFISGSFGVAQDLKTKLQEWKNNCIFNMDAGIPYSIRLGYKGQKDLLDEDIKQIILNNEEVVSLESFESTLNEDREYNATFTYIDIYTVEPRTESIRIGVLDGRGNN